jgi:hypothetical protein
MAKCPVPGCGSKTFKVEQTRPNNVNYDLPLVVCDRCGAAIGVSPEKIYDMLKEIHSRL